MLKAYSTCTQCGTVIWWPCASGGTCGLECSKARRRAQSRDYYNANTWKYRVYYLANRRKCIEQARGRNVLGKTARELRHFMAESATLVERLAPCAD